MSERRYKDLIKPIEFHIIFHVLLAYVIGLISMSYHAGAHGSFWMAIAFEMYDAQREQGADLIDLIFRSLGAFMILLILKVLEAI